MRNIAIPRWEPWQPILVSAEGKAVAGATPQQLVEGSIPLSRFGTMLTWRMLLGTGADQLAPTLEDAVQRLRERLTWEWAITAIARLLAEPVWRIEDQRRLTHAALLDDWPGTVFAADLVAEALLSGESARASVTASALRILLTHLLKERWVDPAHEEQDAERKLTILCRVAMVAGDFIPNTAPEIQVPAERLTYYNAELLLPLLRESTREAPQAIIARADELYSELLPANDPDWEGDVSELEARVLALSVLAEAISRGVREGYSTWFDPTALSADAAGTSVLEPLVQVLDGISLTQAGFAAALAAEKSPIPLPVLSSYPVLRNEEGKYLILERRLLLAAADDEMLRYLDKQHKDFKSRFGTHALEPLVQRMLERCFGPIEGAQIFRVPDEEGRRRLSLPPMGNRKRCDFAILLTEGTLVLVDSKVLMPPLSMLGGMSGLRAFFDSALPRALQQMIETMDDIKDHGLAAVVPGAATRAPLRVHPWVASYQPLGLWFGDGDVILSRFGIEAQWAKHFCAPPYFVSLRDLEFFEANVGSITSFIEARQKRDPRANLDAESFLADILGPGWPMCSERVMERASSVLARKRAPGAGDA